MGHIVRRFPWKARSGDVSAGDLLRECGAKLTDPALWKEFQKRFQGLIFLYLLRALRMSGIEQDRSDIVADLAQEVYIRLVQRDGFMLRSFRGDSEFSVMAFLARIAASVAYDHQRHTSTQKRGGQVISIDLAEADESGEASSGYREFDSASFSAILSWIDIERIVESDTDRKNARRNALIFKLHYIDGFSSAEIARFPGYGLTKSGVDTILARLRKRIQE